MNSLFRFYNKRTRGTVVLLVMAGAIALLMFPARAQTLDEANRAFAKGHYAASVAACQSLLTHQGYSAPVLFDLGNAYAREGKLGEAILAYKRAQWLAPGDPAIAANLRLAQEQASLPPARTDWSREASRFMSASDWAWAASAALLLFCASWLGAMLFPRRKAIFRPVSAVGVLGLIAAGVAVLSWSGELHEAVVIEKNAPALISPFSSAQTAFTPPVGETVSVRKRYDSYLLVEDQAGHTGWISESQIAPIIPGGAAGADRGLSE
jgi:tetratricopeptide (TPR) repeat protein